VFKQHASRGSTITLIATGPLTNVALLLMLYPEVKPFISRIGTPIAQLTIMLIDHQAIEM